MTRMEEAKAGTSAHPFHLDSFACQFSLQIFFDPFPKDSSTFVTRVILSQGASFEDRLSWWLGQGENRKMKTH
jgi:hypothetical protein